MSNKSLWYVKHRPKTLDEYMFQDSKIREAITAYVNDGIFPHLLLLGHRGTGKTALAHLSNHKQCAQIWYLPSSGM